MFTLVRMTVDFSPTDVDVSLKDFPPASSEAVLPLLSLTASPVFDFSFLFFILHVGGKFFKNIKEKQKSSHFIV